MLTALVATLTIVAVAFVVVWLLRSLLGIGATPFGDINGVR